MKFLVIRHGQTDANRLNRIAFGLAGAPLNEAGINQAKLLYEKLLKYGINPKNETVAVSELIRTSQTAEKAGFLNIRVNSLLNEINTANPKNTIEMVSRHEVPEQAIKAAEAIINNPPKEQIWVTHGLVVIALQYVLGMTNKDRFEPDYCEIREINF